MLCHCDPAVSSSPTSDACQITTGLHHSYRSANGGHAVIPRSYLPCTVRTDLHLDGVRLSAIIGPHRPILARGLRFASLAVVQTQRRAL